jgi:hypothetical protein
MRTDWISAINHLPVNTQVLAVGLLLLMPLFPFVLFVGPFFEERFVLFMVLAAESATLITMRIVRHRLQTEHVSIRLYDSIPELLRNAPI